MRTAAVVIALALAAAPAAQAQEGKSKSTPKVQKFDEVERGFWLRADMGLAMAVVDPFSDNRSSGFWPPGPLLQIEMGYDLGQVASIHLALHGQQVSGNRELANRPSVSNDAAMLAPMLGVRFNFVTTKRTAWFIKAAAGWMFTAPSLAEFESGLLIQAGTGLEYATALRHFFVGLEIGGSYDLANGGVLVSLTPTLKYAF